MPKRREDSFFGIHFDFHAVPDEIVARHFHPEVLCEMLDTIRPDYLQFDTKGHPGLSSYPTKAGTQAAEIRHDVLRFLREETWKRDIALYGHHSGLFDQAAILEHPDWAVINEDGSRNPDYVSPFSPYAEERLIPQILELALDYRLDGAWIDGDCWGCKLDYSPWAQKAYGKPAPRFGEEGYEDYREFCRQGFRDYVARYVAAAKAARPDFQITSNWIFSPQMPEKATIPVDFLSGDYDCSNAVISGRRNGRFLAARNMTWDLMSWGQNAIPLSWKTHDRSTKEAAQYMQEAAMILSLGGGYQFFNIAYGGGGYLQRWAFPVWQKTANFCRERSVCFRAKPWSNIALVAPYDKQDAPTPELFSANTPGMKAFYSWLDALCEIQLSPNVILESELDRTDLSGYDLIISPLPVHLPASYAGKVIVDGSPDASQALIWLSDGESLAAMEIPVCEGIGRPVGEYYSRNYFECDSIASPSAYETDGKYQLAFCFAKAYATNVSSTIKNWLRLLLADTGIPQPVRVTGSGFVEVVTTRKGNDLLVNLINLTGDHRRSDVRSFGEIPPLYHLTVTVNDTVYPVERLDIHEILVIENYFS